MKIKHIYTVVREFEITDRELKQELDFFNGSITDAPGEFLYAGDSMDEIITVKIEVGH